MKEKMEERLSTSDHSIWSLFFRKKVNGALYHFTKQSIGCKHEEWNGYKHKISIHPSIHPTYIFKLVFGASSGAQISFLVHKYKCRCDSKAFEQHSTTSTICIREPMFMVLLHIRLLLLLSLCHKYRHNKMFTLIHTAAFGSNIAIGLDGNGVVCSCWQSLLVGSFCACSEHKTGMKEETFYWI